MSSTKRQKSIIEDVENNNSMTNMIIEKVDISV